MVKFLFVFLYNVITLFHAVFEFISAVYVFKYVHIETEINKSHEHISKNIPTKTGNSNLRRQGIDSSIQPWLQWGVCPTPHRITCLPLDNHASVEHVWQNEKESPEMLEKISTFLPFEVGTFPLYAEHNKGLCLGHFVQFNYEPCFFSLTAATQA